MKNGTVPSGSTDERALPLWAIRGFSPPSKERDPARKYSSASYAARYGVPLEDAEELVARNATHQDIERDINRLFSADPDLKRRALNPLSEENAKIEEARSKDAAREAQKQAEKRAKAKARRDRLRRKVFGLAPETEETAE